LFAGPWGGGGAGGIREGGEELAGRAREEGGRLGKGGSAAFNVALCNRMDTAGCLGRTMRMQLKEEREFGMGKVSVSWHADSSLEDGSTIAVYVAHMMEGKEGERVWEGTPEGQERRRKLEKRRRKEAKKAGGEPGEPRPWQVALRVVRDAEGPGSRGGGARRATTR
jgi:hypothetical protein